MKYEYLTANRREDRANAAESDKMLENLGKAGWELVSVVPFRSADGDYGYFYYYFKRPLIETMCDM